MLLADFIDYCEALFIYLLYYLFILPINLFIYYERSEVSIEIALFARPGRIFLKSVRVYAPAWDDARV